MLIAFLDGRKRKAVETSGNSTPIVIGDDEACDKFPIPKTTLSDLVIEASPIQVVHASSPTKKNNEEEEKKTQKDSEPTEQKSSANAGLATSSSARINAYTTLNQIGEVIDFNLPFRTHPTLEIVNALSCRIECVSSERTLTYTRSPIKISGELSVTIDYAAEVRTSPAQFFSIFGFCT